MRESKFRAKIENTDDFVYGQYYSKWIQTSSSDGHFEHYINWAGTDESGQKWNRYESLDVETLGESTGLKDKNGKEIYEGDIVKFVSSISAYRFIPRDEKRVAVIYDDATFKADGLPLCTCYDVLEVIGNIHENPELLK